MGAARDAGGNVLVTATRSSRTGAGAGPWLELVRLSNLPTCVTNVLVGTAIGAAADPDETNAFPWFACAGVSLAIAILYVGGMALNDVVDAPLDREQRSGRPIPSGRIARAHALAFAALALLVGGGGLVAFGTRAFAAGGALVMVIVVYDLVHKRTAASVVLMGACRGLVYVVAALAVAPDPDPAILGTVAGLMTFYVAVVTAFARGEHAVSPAGGRTGWAHVALPITPLLAALVITPAHPARAVAIGLFIVLWSGRSSLLLRSRPPRARDAIMGWLAGICLVDAWTLTLLDQRMLALVAIALFFLTWLGHRRILGT